MPTSTLTEGHLLSSSSTHSSETFLQETTKMLHALDGNINLFELLLNNCRDIMTLHKPDSTYLYASRIVEEVTGFTQQQMLHQQVYDFSHPDFEKDIRDNARRINSGESFLTKPFRYRCANGEYKWFESQTHPLINERGKVCLVVLSFRDITNQSSIDELLRKHQFIGRRKDPYAQHTEDNALVQLQMAHLKRLLETDKLYLNPGLTLSMLAERIGCHPKYLSYLINSLLRTHFSDLVNGYRVEEAKKRLVDPDCKHLSMVGIAYESGFNSKSSFYQAFKRVLRVSPTEFLAS